MADTSTLRLLRGITVLGTTQILTVEEFTTHTELFDAIRAHHVTLTPDQEAEIQASETEAVTFHWTQTVETTPPGTGDIRAIDVTDVTYEIVRLTDDTR